MGVSLGVCSEVADELAVELAVEVRVMDAVALPVGVMDDVALTVGVIDAVALTVDVIDAVALTVGVMDGVADAEPVMLAERLLDTVAEALVVGVDVGLAVASVISQHTPASVGQHGTSSSSPLAVTRTQAASSSEPGRAVVALGSPAAHSAAPSLE